MSLMDKIKSFFSGGSAAGADDHAGHDHAAHDHSDQSDHSVHDHDHTHDPAEIAPPAGLGGMPMSDPGGDPDEDRPA